MKTYILTIKGNDVFNCDYEIEAPNFHTTYAIAINKLIAIQCSTIESLDIIALEEDNGEHMRMI